MLPDLAVARFYTGTVGREEIERLAEAENTYPIVLAMYLFALLNHPDPEERDPEFVLRTLHEREAFLSDFFWPYAAEVLAHMRLGDFQRAVEFFERPSKLRAYMFTPAMSIDFMRALAYARVGRGDEARQWYRLGMFEWEQETADHPEAWERSEAMRWRRETEAALSE
jgi:tetratricopeptide (TPR) repeat protein